MTTPVKASDPQLKDIQANILKGHGRNFAHHIFFQFLPDQQDAARTWIRGFAGSSVTSAYDQLKATALFKLGDITDGGSVITLSLSFSGLNKLGGANAIPASSSFKNGMKSQANTLGDKAENMDPRFDGIDMMIMVADDNAETARNRANEIIDQIKIFATLLIDQKGNVLKTKSGIGIEHFGYADGISQPLYLEEDIDAICSSKEWSDIADTSILLVGETSKDGNEHLGSFLVFRKLEQNVQGFKDAEGDNGETPKDPCQARQKAQVPVIRDVNGDCDRDLAGAMLVGRHEIGTPVVQSSIPRVDNPPRQTNDFNYANDMSGLKCPVHAHTRLMNPRNGLPRPADHDELRKRRITRRGMPYDEVGRIPEDKINEISDDMLDDNQPSGGVGLLFMCYQNSIEGQFEILQGFWIEGNFGNVTVEGEDSLIGHGTRLQKTLPAQWGQPGQTASFTFERFIKTLGGEYLYTPSLSLLKGL